MNFLYHIYRDLVDYPRIFAMEECFRYRSDQTTKVIQKFGIKGILGFMIYEVAQLFLQLILTVVIIGAAVFHIITAIIKKVWRKKR